MPDQYYENIRKKIKSAAGGGAEKTDVLWAIADGVSSIVDGVTGLPIAGSINSHVQGLYAMASSGEGHIVPNPWFVWNGHDDTESTKTKNYLNDRGWLQAGGAAVAVGGAIASTVTAADVGALAQHGNASASTLAHIVKFKAIAKSYKQSETISGWMDIVLKMKMLKGSVRGGQLAAAVLAPIPFGGATAVSITAGVLAGGAKLGIKMKYSNVCLMTAMDLHWRAFQEQAILGGVKGMKPGTGPATRILQELFVRRGFTRVFGQHDLKAFIREPGGWLAISDKLMLI